MAVTPPEGAVEINITPEEWRLLVLVDGVRSVRHIAVAVGLDDFNAMRILYGLVSAGLVDVVGDQELARAQERLEPEDPSRSPAEDPRAWLEPFTIAPEAISAAPEPPGPAAEPLGPPAPGPARLGASAAEAERERSEATPFDDEEPVMETPPLEPVEEAEGARAEAPSPPTPPLEGSPAPAGAEADSPPERWFEDPMGPSTRTAPPEGAEVEAAAAETPPAETPPGAEEPAAEERERPPEDASAEGGARASEPRLDRSAAARELAGLFSDAGRSPRPASGARAEPEDEPDAVEETPERRRPEESDERKRVEDDEGVTKGLISRLIDGVKGL
jgi:hypothetical protein